MNDPLYIKWKSIQPGDIVCKSQSPDNEYFIVESKGPKPYTLIGLSQPKIDEKLRRFFIDLRDDFWEVINYP